MRGIGKADISVHTTDRRLLGYLQFLLRLKVVEISVSTIVLGHEQSCRDQEATFLWGGVYSAYPYLSVVLKAWRACRRIKRIKCRKWLQWRGSQQQCGLRKEYYHSFSTCFYLHLHSTVITSLYFPHVSIHTIYINIHRKKIQECAKCFWMSEKKKGRDDTKTHLVTGTVSINSSSSSKELPGSGEQKVPVIALSNVALKS